MKPEKHSVVEYQPAHFVNVEQVVHVYRGANGKIIRADHPETLLRTSIATPSLAAGIMNGKYVNHLPLTRMETIFRNAGLPLSHQDMANWMMTLTERYMMLLYDRLKEELLSHHVIHADETPVQVTKDGRKAGTDSYMIVYRSNVHETHPVVEYDYHKTRNADYVHEYAGKFKGILVCDGNSIYERFAKDHPDVTLASCWVHMRRGFATIVKTAKKKEKQTRKYTLAAYAIKQIAVIYQLDNALWDLDREERRKERDLTVRKHVEAFFDWCRAKLPETAPKSKIAESLSYALKRESTLKTFLDDPDVPLDNNPAERAIRPFCTGRNSWHIIDTVRGAQNSAVLYSIAETAKANNLVPYEYYKYVLEHMLEHMNDTNLEFVEDLLPWSDAVKEKCSVPEIPKPEEMKTE
ncbi:MAG: IS66 family transposase [Eubacterium sp.]|nr:IS66 family transposase [Eubacterium sp.]MCH4046123.1 IS66 family transposase [Eubacterium sp.]MCH4079218.1 IS66 family transposase [Eubacterium sp.]MCH4110442.1 IS66 family transposase [Eubacterium sp.]